MLCLVIFLADVVAGIFVPTFALYARDIGVSLALLGSLNTIGGCTQLATSLPLGIVSDLIGRTRVLFVGMLTFAAALLLLASAGSVWALLVGRMMFAIASVATFQIGATYLGDVTLPEQRSLAFGVFTTAMGLGFAIGPLLGGYVAGMYGTPGAYVLGAGVAMLGLLVAATSLSWRPPARPAQTMSRRGRHTIVQDMRAFGSTLDLVLVTFGNFLVTLTFSGAITTFFPVYGREIGLSPAAIGVMFTVRATVSTIGRFPNGVISRVFSSWAVIIAALVLNIVAMFGISATTDPLALSAFLAAEGLAFGAYLVAGQTYVADRTIAESRGTAVGLYATAGSIGGAFAPLVLGMIADRFGIAEVFVVTGWTLVAGLGILALGLVAVRERRMV